MSEENKPKLIIVGSDNIPHVILEKFEESNVSLAKIADIATRYTDPYRNLEPLILKSQDYLYHSLPKKLRDKEIIQVRDSSINPKINRNEPCPCGSGKKYKHCCNHKIK